MPPPGRLVRICGCFGGKEFFGRLGVAEAEPSDAYNQLPLKSEDERAAVVTPRDPFGGGFPRFAQRAHLFGSTAAGSYYNCFAKIKAFLARRIPMVPRVCYLDDFGAMASLMIVGGALAFSAELNDLPDDRMRRFRGRRHY